MNSQESKKNKCCEEIEKELCPVCGYYCSGKGGMFCIDKMSLFENHKKTHAPQTEENEIAANFMQIGNSHCFGCHKTFPPESEHTYFDCMGKDFKGLLKSCKWDGKECYPHSSQEEWAEELLQKFGYHVKSGKAIQTATYEELRNFISEKIEATRQESLRSLEKEVEGMNRTPTKHDLCTMDDSWCYDHQEIVKEEEFSNGAFNYNQALSDVLAIIHKKMGE